MKKFFEFTLATLVFCAVMDIVISIYTAVNGIDEPYDHIAWLFWLNVSITLLYILSFGVLMYFIVMNTRDFVRHYEKPEHRPLMFHSKAEISWVEVEYDDEGEEIRRDKHALEVVHNMCRSEDDATMDYVVQSWHTWRRMNNMKNAKSAQDFCDYVNTHTMYKAAPTRDEFINLLLQKK